MIACNQRICGRALSACTLARCEWSQRPPRRRYQNLNAFIPHPLLYISGILRQ